jgi:hypothetical protein
VEGCIQPIAGHPVGGHIELSNLLQGIVLKGVSSMLSAMLPKSASNPLSINLQKVEFALEYSLPRSFDTPSTTTSADLSLIGSTSAPIHVPA